MTSTAATATLAKLAALIARAEKAFVNGTGSGRAWRKATRVINGHAVQVNIFGSDDIQIWIDKSSEPLSMGQAIDRIAA